ncbi:uncharacterized protein [Amphiura filiformis]|uniref:uncharacterized protein isoform X2 n=1 Tax=Amphiura filiformis TaxID=82378 RepID=UPI003B21C697
MMQYIENQDLREWVKKSLRKTIVLKVHELAMQTGCEVLLKIRDEADNDGNFYYATESLQEEYSSKGLCKQSNEMCVSGETGMPVYPKVSIATQKDSEQPVAKSTKPVENATSTENNLEDDDSPLPLQLTVTDEQDVEEIRELEPKIKMEVVEDGESENDSMEIPIPSLLIGDDDTNDLAAAYGMEDMDNPSTLQVYLPSVAPKLYQCAICQKAFRSVQVLQKHTQAFHAKSSMSVRMKSKGAGVKLGRALAPKRHSCTVCSRNFPNVTLLNDHMSRSHMMASTNFQHASMEEQPQQFDNETSSSSDPTMPKISQVMSLQGGVMQISTATSSHSTFTMASPTSNPIFQSAGPSTSGASTSMSGIKPRSSTPARGRPGKALQLCDGTVTMSTIMSAILLSAGPLTSFISVVKNRKSLRKITKQQFQSACEELQGLGLGFLVTIEVIAQHYVFIKEKPENASEILDVNRDLELCTPREYRDRYILRMPAYPTYNRTVQEHLIALAYVPSDCFQHLKNAGT